MWCAVRPTPPSSTRAWARFSAAPRHRTASLLQSVTMRLGGIQKLLIQVMVVLTSLSFVLCLTALLFLGFKEETPFKEALEFTVVVLVASIPIAI